MGVVKDSSSITVDSSGVTIDFNIHFDLSSGSATVSCRQE